MGRVIIIGLDGATWDLLKPWINKGALPSIGNVIKQGVHANFLSTIPPVTGPAWTSLATGRNPGKHGIFGFQTLKKGKISLNTPNDIKCSSIYEMLSNNGIESLIIGLPLSFPPPKSYKGIMVSDFFYPIKSIFPKSKERYLKNYEVAPSLFKSGDDLLNDMIETSIKQIQTAKELFHNEQWDFYFFLFSETDQVSHSFWNDMINMTPRGKKAQKIFKLADEFIGWIKNEMKKEDILIICSDHGFGNNKHTINLNSILKKYGLIKTKLTANYRVNSVWANIQKMRGENIKNRNYFISKIYWEILNSPFLKPFANINGKFKNLLLVNWLNLIFEKLFGSPFYKEGIDFNKSIAYIPSSEWMGICINSNNNKIKNRLIKIFKNLKYNGQSVFRRVYSNSEIYSGKFVDLGPDIIFISDHFVTSATLTNELFTQNYPISTHKLTGIFIAYGNEIKEGVNLDYTSIYDIAPTILHEFDLKIPSDIDGRVLKNIYKNNSEKAKREVKFVDESDKIKDTIRNLTKLKSF